MSNNNTSMNINKMVYFFSDMPNNEKWFRRGKLDWLYYAITG